MDKIFAFLSNEGLHNFTNPILLFLSKIEYYLNDYKYDNYIRIVINNNYSFEFDENLVNKLLDFLKDHNYKLVDFLETDISYGYETQTYSVISLDDKLYTISYFYNSYGDYCDIDYKEVKIKSIETIIEYQ